MQDIRKLGADYRTLHVNTFVGSLHDMFDNPHHKAVRISCDRLHGSRCF